jgi:copper transport protein
MLKWISPDTLPVPPASCRSNIHQQDAGGTGAFGMALLAALGLFILLGMLAPTPAHAQALHARLAGSVPADGSVLAEPPALIRLVFSEPVQIAGQPITVLAPSGAEVERGPAQVNGRQLTIAVDAREQGTYLVLWQVISLDTDPANGSLIFSVGHPAGRWTGGTGQTSAFGLGVVLAAASRWLYYAGYALGFGVLAFRWLILRALLLKNAASLEQRLWRLVTAGILLMALAAPLALLAQLISLATGDLFSSALVGAVLSSRFGWVLALRLGGALLLWVLVGAAKEGARLAVALALALGLALALLESLVSHSITSSQPALGLVGTTLHMLGMGLWLGGLAALLGTWRESALVPHRREVVGLFGQLAIASVVELAGSGLLLAWLHLTQWSDLFTTTYGLTLFIKGLLVPGALALALIGRRSLLEQSQRWWQREALALAGILALAGLLTSLAPPR